MHSTDQSRGHIKHPIRCSHTISIVNGNFHLLIAAPVGGATKRRCSPVQ